MKASVKINQDEWVMMGDVAQYLTEAFMSHIDVLPQMIVLDFYEKNLSKFTFVQDKTKTLKAFEMLCWIKVLIDIPMSGNYTSILRNNVINKFTKGLEAACPGQQRIIQKSLETSS